MESFLAAVFEGTDTIAVVAVVGVAQGFSGGWVAGLELELLRWRGRFVIVCCSYLDLARFGFGWQWGADFPVTGQGLGFFDLAWAHFFGDEFTVLAGCFVAAGGAEVIQHIAQYNILGDAFSVFVHEAKVDLCIGITLFG